MIRNNMTKTTPGWLFSINSLKKKLSTWCIK